MTKPASQRTKRRYYAQIRDSWKWLDEQTAESWTHIEDAIASRTPWTYQAHDQYEKLLAFLEMLQHVAAGRQYGEDLVDRADVHLRAMQAKLGNRLFAQAKADVVQQIAQRAYDREHARKVAKEVKNMPEWWGWIFKRTPKLWTETYDRLRLGQQSDAESKRYRELVHHMVKFRTVCDENKDTATNYLNHIKTHIGDSLYAWAVNDANKTA